jgi:hypothetical protein
MFAEYAETKRKREKDNEQQPQWFVL